MQHMRFMVLTGHLDDYSLPGLIKMLHGQRKTGRLQIDYAESPAAFYFEDGRLVDARIGDLRGLEAVYLALSLAGASFNFNPLIEPPERTVKEREQKLINGLLEAPAGRGSLDISVTGSTQRGLPQALPTDANHSLLPAAADSKSVVPAGVEERLITEVGTLLASHSKRFGRERAIYATIIAVLLLLTVISRLRDDAASTDSQSLPNRSEVNTPGTNLESQPSPETSKDNVPTADRTKAVESVPVQTPGSPRQSAAKNNVRSNNPPQMPGASEPARQKEAKKSKDSSAGDQGERIVKVLLRVEHGRVLQAVVQNSNTKLASFESLALRIARQRQYPPDFSGQDVLQLKVKP
ncbi:MAG TPA: DUF4388 domain-containing protein [Pyrinomonadaceae bacterium]|nr:DUF4388 domain-containing protein [Pyrinomonadaceae bacterium]